MCTARTIIASAVSGITFSNSNCCAPMVQTLRQCSADALNQAWFRATVGGLGLTGLIRKASLRLRPVASPWIEGDQPALRQSLSRVLRS
jgi:FAD/FMN-containing dehydrogenase